MWNKSSGNAETQSAGGARLFWGVIGLAVFFRVWGVWHGYPYSYYPDEAHFVKRALSFGSGDFNPHWFHKPALYMYLLFIEYGLMFVAGKVAGLWPTVTDFAVSYIINPGPFYLVGRLTTVLFSLGSIGVVYVLGKRHFSQNVGLAAGLFLCCSVGHVVSSQDVKADTPAMFFGILSLMFILNHAGSGRNSDIIWAILFSAMGTATKVYPIVLLVPITASLFHQRLTAAPDQPISRRLLGGAARALAALTLFWGVYFLFSPYSFIDPLGRDSTFAPFLSAFRKLGGFFGADLAGRPSDFIVHQTDFTQGLASYFKVLVDPGGMGTTIAGLSIAGFLVLARKVTFKTILFFTYPLLFIVLSVFTSPGYAEARHQLPVYPVMSLAAGAGAVFLAGIRPVPGWGLALILALILVHPVGIILKRAVVISRPDTRNLAKQWIETHIPDSAKLLIDENGVQLVAGRPRLDRLMARAQRADRSGQFTAHYGTYLKYQQLASRRTKAYDYDEIRFPWWRYSESAAGVKSLTSEYDRDMANPIKPVGVEAYDYYVQNGFSYAVVHQSAYKKFFNDSDYIRRYPSFASFYRELFQRAELVWSADNLSLRDHYPGPDVKIYRFSP